MIELITRWFDGLMHIINTAPLQLWAMVLGTLISWAFTQRTKFLIPERYSRAMRHRIAQGIAFVTGFATTFALWPDRYGFVVAILVGMISPITYRIAMSYLAKKFPDTRRILSMDYPDGTAEPEKKEVPAKVVAVNDEEAIKVEIQPLIEENS